MSPNELKELLAELKAEIPEINKTKGVINDSMLANKLDAHQREDNMILVGVLPEYGSSGTNVDNVKETTMTQLMVLEKTSYSDVDEDEFWDIFQRSYVVMRKIKEAIIRKATEECLPYLSNINVDGLDISPVWGLSDCNGYSIDIDIL